MRVFAALSLRGAAVHSHEPTQRSNVTERAVRSPRGAPHSAKMPSLETLLAAFWPKMPSRFLPDDHVPSHTPLPPPRPLVRHKSSFVEPYRIKRASSYVWSEGDYTGSHDTVLGCCATAFCAKSRSLQPGRGRPARRVTPA